MRKPIKRLIIGITIATAAAAGALAATDFVSVHKADTAWGASTTGDTGWGIPPTSTPLPTAIPLDTGWG